MASERVRQAVKVVSAAYDAVRPAGDGLAVLIYHRVGRRTDVSVDLPAELFREQLELLAEHHQVLTLGRRGRAARAGRAAARQAGSGRHLRRRHDRLLRGGGAPARGASGAGAAVRRHRLRRERPGLPGRRPAHVLVGAGRRRLDGATSPWARTRTPTRCSTAPMAPPRPTSSIGPSGSPRPVRRLGRPLRLPEGAPRVAGGRRRGAPAVPHGGGRGHPAQPLGRPRPAPPPPRAGPGERRGAVVRAQGRRRAAPRGSSCACA